jgi:hypothetical protein
MSRLFLSRNIERPRPRPGDGAHGGGGGAAETRRRGELLSAERRLAAAGEGKLSRSTDTKRLAQLTKTPRATRFPQVAIESGHLAMARCLVRHGAAREQRLSSCGSTALHIGVVPPPQI